MLTTHFLPDSRSNLEALPSRLHTYYMTLGHRFTLVISTLNDPMGSVSVFVHTTVGAVKFVFLGTIYNRMISV
jgi:hypothetical protein